MPVLCAEDEKLIVKSIQYWRKVPPKFAWYYFLMLLSKKLFRLRLWLHQEFSNSYVKWEASNFVIQMSVLQKYKLLQKVQSLNQCAQPISRCLWFTLSHLYWGERTSSAPLSKRACTCWQKSYIKKKKHYTSWPGFYVIFSHAWLP